MARRIILHIGTMKSATTFIQDLCDLNSAELRDQGVLWLGSSDNFGAFHDLINPDVESDVEAWYAGRWQRVSKRIDRFDGDVLISNELMAAMRPSNIETVLDSLAPAEVQVVITLRDLGRVVPSHWQTLCRNRSRATWRHYIKGVTGKNPFRYRSTRAAFWRRQDLDDIITRWSTKVPIDKITVITVPPAGSDRGEIGRRFGSVIGIDLSALPHPPRSNPSLGAYSAEFLRRINTRTRHFDQGRYQLAVKRILGRRLASRSDLEPSLGLSAKEFDRVQVHTNAAIEVLETSGVRLIGDVEDLRSPADLAIAEPVDPGRATDADLLAVGIDAVGHLNDAIEELAVEYGALVEQVRVDGALTDAVALIDAQPAIEARVELDLSGSTATKLATAEVIAVRRCDDLAELKTGYDRLVDAVLAERPIRPRGPLWREFVATVAAPTGRQETLLTRRGTFVMWRFQRRRGKKP